MKHDQCKSKFPSKSVNNFSVGSIRDVHKRNLKRIIPGHVNINSIRNKFDLLVNQIKGNVDKHSRLVEVQRNFLHLWPWLEAS